MKQDELFFLEEKGHHNATFNVTMKNGKKIAKKLQKLEDGGEEAVKHTVSDFKSRAPGWVSKGIRKHYGVDEKAIDKAGPTFRKGKPSGKVSGISIDGIELFYKGGLLTPTHFNMVPKVRPDALQKKWKRIPGQAVAGGSDVAMMRQPKKYTVKATIIKGQRASMKQGTFLAQKDSAGPWLPFQREGKKRLPVAVVRTLSVPQMIDGRAKKEIDETIDKNLEKRFEHYIKRAMK